MAPVSPTVTGTVASYTVAPALPAGVTLSSGTGVISGTPTAVAATANYTITASNAGGNAAATVAITVNDVAPTISYSSASLTLTTGVPLQSLAPTNSGGAAVTWSVSPGLPAGLTLNSTTGAIGGTPTAVSSATTYTVTASNSGGSGTATLSIAVQSGLLVDLGHASGIAAVRLSATRVLSADDETNGVSGGPETGAWVLWNYTTAAKISGGTWTCSSAICLARKSAAQAIDLAGSTFVDETPAGLEIRSAADGTVLATVPTPIAWWKLASDGSYVAVGSTSGLQVLSPAGAVVATRTGDYSNGSAFAAPGQVQIAGGAAGANVVETVALPSGGSTTSPAFQGTFQSWFTDGQRFLTATANTVWVYSSAAAQQDIKAFSAAPQQFGGAGDWFWVGGSSVDIYKVGASATPTASYTLPALSVVSASAATLGLLVYGTGASVVDLSGSTPVKTDFATPVVYSTAYAATSASQWVLGNDWGVLLDGPTLASTPRYFGYGAAWSIAGSSQTIAVATASGTILLFDAATRAPLPSLAFSASYIALSADGSVLAAAGDELDNQYHPDQTVNVYSLPALSVLNSWPYTFPNVPTSISLATAGQVLGQVTSGASCMRQANTIVGGALLWSDSYPGNAPYVTLCDGLPVVLSPDGTEVAVSNGRDITSGTNMYKNGALVTTVTGWALAWLDNSRLLVENFQHFGMDPTARYAGATIYAADGTRIMALPSLPEIAPGPEASAIVPVDANSIYDPMTNTIYSLTTGAALWTSASPANARGVGAVAGANVVFLSGNQVLVQPY